MLHLLSRSFPRPASFLLLALNLKVYFTQEVSPFTVGILSESQSAALMAITLPDVGLLTMTPPRRFLPSLNGPPCPN